MTERNISQLNLDFDSLTKEVKAQFKKSGVKKSDVVDIVRLVRKK